MKVLVDTSVWSLALRRRAPAEHPAVRELRLLVTQGRVAMLGVIRQDLLSGIRTAPDADFKRFGNLLPITLHGA